MLFGFHCLVYLAAAPRILPSTHSIFLQTISHIPNFRFYTGINYSWQAQNDWLADMAFMVHRAAGLDIVE